MIEHGDPDGLGDLKRYNQVAFRAECVYGWRVIDHDGFVVLRDASTIPEGSAAAASAKASK